MCSSAVFGRFAEPGRLLPSGPALYWLAGFQNAGLDIGTRLLPLENSDLVAQLFCQRERRPDQVLRHIAFVGKIDARFHQRQRADQLR